MQYTITALNGDTVRIESENWMMAMGKALVFFDLDIADVERIVCSPGADGTVFVEEPERNRSWMLRLTDADVVAKVSERSELENWVKDEVEVEVTIGEEIIPEALDMPESSFIQHDDVLPDAEIEPTSGEDINESTFDEAFPEKLFELGMELYEADDDVACQLALDLLMSTLNAGAGSVVRGTLNDDALRFVAAAGPVSESLIGRRIEFGEGLVGMCFDVRGTLKVDDVSSNTRHLDQFDEETGFKTVSAVCAPILDHQTSLIYGVVQLLNPPTNSFSEEDAAKVEQVARTLAERLGRE